MRELTERAREMIQRGVQSIDASSGPQGQGPRRRRSAGCPFASSRAAEVESGEEYDRQERLAELFQETSRQLLLSLPKSKRTARAVDALADIVVDGTNLTGLCNPAPTGCNFSYPFRYPDGSCNNQEHTDWGKVGSCMRKLLRPDYSDIVDRPRAASSGEPLPPPRVVSYTVHPARQISSPNMTELGVLFGQFITHDVSQIPRSGTPTAVNDIGKPFQSYLGPGAALSCCNYPQRASPQCIPIAIEDDDPFYGNTSLRCINLVRATPCFECKLGYRLQRDDRTSYLDASAVYGAKKEETDILRSFQKGLLRSRMVNGEELLPPSSNPERDGCSDPSKDKICFTSGDGRVNQSPGLTVIQTLFMRQHNRIAKMLRSVNKGWNDERLFQVAKRIVESQFQHVVYGEWLPTFAGRDAVEKYDLMPLQTGFTTYNSSVDATMIDEFPGAAFRMGHSLVSGTFLRVNTDGHEQVGLLRDWYFQPFGLYQNELDDIMRGMLLTPMDSFDRFASPDINQYLFIKPPNKFGLDIISVDVQRGRDLGVRGYPDYVEFCSGVKINTFDDLYLKNLMPKDTAEIFQNLYKNVSDIDLFSGAIAEYVVEGTVASATVHCITNKMFQRLKWGDRFFYEHADQAGSFTQAQLDSLRNTTYAGIICANSRSITAVQRNPFIPEGPGNPKVNCSEIPDIDISHWRSKKR
ncbi:chorion peroxidase-like [Ixodes scapularis]